jgi:uncharacterized SAM-binding protein YcdF (DUF218 family)
VQRLADLPASLGILLRNALRYLGPAVRSVLLCVGCISVLMIVLAGTRVPYDAHRALGTGAGECTGPVDVLVLLGGSGMPSGAELRRLHHASEWAATIPLAQVWVVHPGDTSVIGAMERELCWRGVAKARIRRVNEGENTREQALAVHRLLAGKQPALGLVTAPENMYRSVQAFRKVGLGQVCGSAAWDHAMDHRFTYTHARIGGKAYVPDVSGSTGLRYTFWNYLKLEITCLREYVAIAYYRVNGWI